MDYANNVILYVRIVIFPSKLPNVFGIAMAISMFMIVIARPLATFIVLAKFKFSNKEKLFISWVGLRGAASVVLQFMLLLKE